MLNVKYQRKMINALLESDTGVSNWILNARFRLRSSLEAPNANNVQSEKEIAEARLYLQQWLEDATVAQKSPKLEFFCAFEIAESLFASEAYDRSNAYFRKAQTLLEQREELRVLLQDAKNELQSRSLKALSLPSSLPIGCLPRSTISLPGLETRLASFLAVLAPQTEKNNDSTFLAVDDLLSAIHTNKSPQQAIFQQLVQILEDDLEHKALYFDFKLHLATLPPLAPIADQIREINVTWRIINTDEEPSLSWLAGVSNLRIFFASLLSRSDSCNETSGQQERFLATLRIISEQLLDDTVYSELAKRDASFQSTLTSSVEALRSSLQTCGSQEPQEYENDAFMALTRSRSPETLKLAANSFSTLRGASLTSRIIERRIKECEKNQDFESAVILYTTLREALKVEHFWDEFMAHLCTSPASYTDDKVLEEAKSLMDRELYPSAEVASRISTWMLNREGFQLFDDFGLLLQRSASSPNAIFLRQVYTYAKHVVDLWRCVSSLHPSLEISKISDSFSAAAVHFEAIISVAIRDVRGWAAELLGALRHAEVLKALASISLFSLDFLYRSSKLPCEALHIDRINKTLASLSSERDHAWMSQVKSVNLVAISSLHSIFSRILFALQRTLPNDPYASLCLGDISLLKGQHETALRFFLRSIFSTPLLDKSKAPSDYTSPHSANTSHIASSASPSSARILGLLPSLIHCFTHLRLYHYAILLHQYAPTVDYKASLTLMAAWGSVFPRQLFPFVFDLPLLETLAHTLHRAGNLADAQYVASLIAKPEHVALEFAPKALEISRSKFMLHLAQQFLENGNWNGEAI